MQLRCSAVRTAHHLQGIKHRNVAAQPYNVESTATVSPGTPICMIALNPHTEKALRIQGTADIKANACAVHVNSDNPRNALYQNGSGTATAQSFCVKGEHSDSNFSPPATDNCAAENDPLTTVFAAVSRWTLGDTSTRHSEGIHTPVLFDGNNTTRLVTQAGASITSARTSGLFKGIALPKAPYLFPVSRI
jgi:hypothetical protein